MKARHATFGRMCLLTAICLSSTGLSIAADPGWPVTKNGTVYASNGAKIRGYMRNFYNAPGNPALLTGTSEYEKARKYKLNAIRFWVRAMYNSDGTLDTSPYASYPMNDVLKYMDAVVDMCARYGMYCVLDYHIITGKFSDSDLKRAKEWWSKVAPRFKGRPHVIYELYNEPSYSAGMGESGALRMLDLYKHVRSLAPNNHIITFSMGRYEYAATITNMVDHVGSQIDWKKTSVGYHSYGWSRGTEASLVEGMKKYPLINTELGDGTHIPIMERIGCAFAAWGKPQDHPEYVTWDGSAPAPSTNKLPVITVSVSSSSVQPGQTVAATAGASDPDGKVVSVTWFLDAENLGKQTVSPWKWVVPMPATAGTYRIWATATDDKGGSSSSSPVEVKVQSGGTLAGAPAAALRPQARGSARLVARYRVDGRAVGSGPAGVALRGSARGVVIARGENGPAGCELATGR